MERRPRSHEGRRALALALPGIAWLTLFFLLPLVFVVVASVLTDGTGASVVLPFTLEHYEYLTGRGVRLITRRTLGFAVSTTLICLLLGFPLALYIARRESPRVRLILLFLVLLPFWTNFLVRTYALITLLQREGLVNEILLRLGVVSEPVRLLFTEGAVILGLVYGYLPFMVLPVYAAVERLDRRFVEAAHDLGANDWTAFWRVVVPLTLPGVVAGTMLVFIPAFGAFITPDLMGGTDGFMLGNLIQRQLGGRGNIPRGAAMSVVMLVIVFAGALVAARWGRGEAGR